MKDIKFKIFASALASVLLVGCNDLDTEPLGAVVTSDQKEEVVKNDPEMVSASVTGITAMFSVYGNAIPTSFGHDDFGYGSIMLNLDSRGTDMVGLDINYNWFTRSMTFEDLFFNYRPTNILWRTMYNQIYTANGVVSTIDPATEDSSLKYYLAQALSIRAFDYFVLAQMYQHTYKGNESKPCVPLITNENANEAAANGCARSTVQEVYDQIMSDLNKAVSLLEATDKTRGTDKRYISKEVAYGLRARVNLTMQNWTAAAEDAVNIRKSIRKRKSLCDRSEILDSGAEAFLCLFVCVRLSFTIDGFGSFVIGRVSVGKRIAVVRTAKCVLHPLPG